MELHTGEYHNHLPNRGSNLFKLSGIAICRTCKSGTGFEIMNNVPTYVSGRSSYGLLNDTLSDTVKMLYSEAEKSFQNGLPDAAVAMSRASIDVGLTQAGFEGSNLPQQIGKARTAGILSDVEVGLAEASRLITRESIHHGKLVPLSDVPPMLSAAIQILNKLPPPTKQTDNT
jgi:hypothetical protein